MKQAITIVIPTWNEKDNIVPLVTRIHAAMKKARRKYTMIFIDDRSTDGTLETIFSLKEKYPILLLRKNTSAMRGKASSLLSGFSYAKTNLVAMIDADLQYPPEAIELMIKKIDKGADVVIADRTTRQTGVLRRVFSSGYKFIFGKMLHGFAFDVQSGLKVFRKEIVDRIDIRPTQWMFDLEFLLAAKHAGYTFDSVPIRFEKRYSGKAKISIVQAMIEMAIAAIRLKFRPVEAIRFHAKTIAEKGKGFHYRGSEFVSHTDLSHHESALYRFSRRQIFVLLGMVCVLFGALIVNWHMSVTLLIAGITTLYFVDLLFNALLIHRTFTHAPEIVVTEEEIEAIPDKDWPTYTIFCPLYKEWQVLPQFVTAISRLDYPKGKLQIMLLLEEDDKETIKHAKAYKLPQNFDIVVVPHSFPKTKPKASNYGLTKAEGEYVVIYDAEDVPDPLQLKKAVLAFAKNDKKMICVQAKLNFYNPHHNLLTKLFTAEYSLWFDLVLTGLQSIRAPIPLGGTSNHFRTADLLKLKGWDAFNVTEDCDLGMRLVKRGYHTAIIESTTYEEANSDFFNWFNQRSRWIKGYIQTYLVHMRRPGDFANSSVKHHSFTFQLVVGGKIFALFVNPLMWALTVVYFVFRPIVGETIESFYPSIVFYMAAFSLIAGNFLYLYYYMVGCAKRGHYDVIKYAYIVPVYWLMMSISAWKAVYQFIVNPHYWAKTKHGLHLTHNNAIKQARSVVGKELVDQKLGSVSMQPALSSV